RLVLTRAYGLASAYDARNQEIDPEDALVWRAAYRRLDAEGLRDAMLVVAGKLDAAPPGGSLVAGGGNGPSPVRLRLSPPAGPHPPAGRRRAGSGRAVPGWLRGHRVRRCRAQAGRLGRIPPGAARQRGVPVPELSRVGARASRRCSSSPRSHEG